MSAKKTGQKKKSAALKKLFEEMESEEVEEPVEEQEEEKMTEAEKLLKKAAETADGDIDDEGFIEIKLKNGKWTPARVCAIEYDGIDAVYKLSVMDEEGNLPNKITMIAKVKDLEIRATNSVLSEFGVQRTKDPESWSRFGRVKTEEGWNILRGMFNVFLFSQPLALTCTLTNIYEHIR